MSGAQVSDDFILIQKAMLALLVAARAVPKVEGKATDWLLVLVNCQAGTTTGEAVDATPRDRKRNKRVLTLA